MTFNNQQTCVNIKYLHMQKGNPRYSVFSIQLNEIDIRKGEIEVIIYIYYKIFSTHFYTQIKLLNTEYLNTLCPDLCPELTC